MDSTALRNMSNSMEFYKREDSKRDFMRVVLPKARLDKLLFEFHNSPTGGHFGYARTLQKITRDFYWPEMEKDVRKYCEECLICAQNNPSNQIFEEFGTTPTPQYPFEYIQIDIMGPYPKSDRISM